MSISMGPRLLQLPPGEEYKLTPSEIAKAKREKKEEEAQARRRAKSNKNLRRYAVRMINPGAFANEVRYQWAESAREARKPGLFGDQPVWNLKATLVPGQPPRSAGQASKGNSMRDHACSCSHPKPKKPKKKAAHKKRTSSSRARRIPQGMIHVLTSADGRRMGNYSGNKNDTVMFMDPAVRRDYRPVSGGASPKTRSAANRRTVSRDTVTKTCPIGTEIQTLILSQQMFNERQAAGWAKRHGFRVIKVDVTANNYRFRQHPPSNFRAGSFRTIRLRPGVEAVIGCPA